MDEDVRRMHGLICSPLYRSKRIFTRDATALWRLWPGVGTLSFSK